jgi:hypothetical protein
MVAVDSLANSLPRALPTMRSKIARLPRLPVGHDDAGNDEGGYELQQSTSDAGDEAQSCFRQFANLRLHAPHQRRQVSMCLGPNVVDSFADDRPLFDAGTWGWNLQRVVPHVVDQLMHRIAKRIHQHRRRRYDQNDAKHNQQGCGKSLLAPDLAGQVLVERIDRDGQDQRPDRQGQERREDPVAKHGHGEDQAGADQNIQQRGSQWLFELLIRPGG